MKRRTRRKEDTSWGPVASWYDDLLSGSGTYQETVILPKLLPHMRIQKTDRILDVACGQGFFTRAFARYTPYSTGIDVAPELIAAARSHSDSAAQYAVAPSNNLAAVCKPEAVDKVSVVLALQNISDLAGTIRECFRVLKPGGRAYFVLNHPSFRVPKKSDWGYDAKNDMQYRRVDQYLSESMVRIDMNPGERETGKKRYTYSFHRPLQSYAQTLSAAGFFTVQIEEWISDKKSQRGPRQKAEDRARKEIPMFLYIEAEKPERPLTAKKA